MLNETTITALIAKGFSRWTKNGKDRLYINARDLGLTCTYYKTGNIHTAEINGEYVSNSEARRMQYAKTYIDIATGEVVSDNDTLQAAAEAILTETIAETTETIETDTDTNTDTTTEEATTMTRAEAIAYIRATYADLTETEIDTLCSVTSWDDPAYLAIQTKYSDPESDAGMIDPMTHIVIRTIMSDAID